jgi:hypothetical protein
MTSFKIRHETLGSHVHCQLFAGADPEHRALTGNFCMRQNEFDDFKNCIKNDYVVFDERR